MKRIEFLCGVLLSAIYLLFVVVSAYDPTPCFQIPADAGCYNNLVTVYMYYALYCNY